MIYKITAIVAALAAGASLWASATYRTKAEQAAVLLREAREMQREAQDREQKAVEELQSLIQRVGEPSEQEVTALSEQAKERDAQCKELRDELQSFLSKQTEDRERLRQSIAELKDEVKELQMAVDQRVLAAAQSDALSEKDRAELEEIVDTLLTVGRHYSATGKLYVRRIADLATLVLDGASVDVTLPETKGNTMLHYACALCCFELFDWLVEHNADVNKLTDKGKSPLDCVGEGEDAEILRYHIVKHGGRKGR